MADHHVRRIALLQVGLLGLSAILLCRLVWMQCIQYQRWQTSSERNRIRLVPELAERGRLLDRQGRALAETRLAFDVMVSPEDVSIETLEWLSKRLDISVPQLEKRIARRTAAPYWPVSLAMDVTLPVVAQLEESRPYLSGVWVQAVARRHYPDGPAVGSLVGYLSQIDADTLERRRDEGYVPGDIVGKTGLEMLLDPLLRGEKGGWQIEVDAHGRQSRILGYQPDQPGQDVQLTIDRDLQKRAADLLGDDPGACVILDVRTGDVLALASSPSFDPNDFITIERSANRLRWIQDPRRPFFNRAISAQVPPGSVFKVVTSTAALSSGKWTPQTRRYCPGFFKFGNHIFGCWNEEGHQSVQFLDAIAYSCNVYFYQAALAAGVGRLSDIAQQFRLNRRTGVELPGEQTGLVPNVAWKRKVWRAPWYEGETVSFGIGQSYLQVTPIQVAQMMAIIASDGWVRRPHLLAATAPLSERASLPPDVLEWVRRGMRQVVERPNGTAHKMNDLPVTVAGKTGTAQAGTHRRSHGWFAGFAPADQPQISFVVFLEHGGYGSLRPTDIAKELVRTWYEKHASPLA